MSADIKDIGDQRRPVVQRQGQVGAGQHHIVAARRTAEAVEDEVGSRQVEGAKLWFRAADQQGEIRAAIAGQPTHGRRQPGWQAACVSAVRQDIEAGAIGRHITIVQGDIERSGQSLGAVRAGPVVVMMKLP